MRITLIYDNTSTREDLRADWGFACLIEIKGKPNILFDTGANGSILLRNMERLSIDPSDVSEVFISHDHWDHTGGLSDILGLNSKVRLFVPKSFSHTPTVKEIIRIGEPQEIMEDIFTTGELADIEQSLAVRTEKGLVVIVGCSHPGVESILNAAAQFGTPYALIGGLHGLNRFEILKPISLICPCHCTQHQREIFSLYPETSIDGGAGRIIDI